MDWVFMQSSQGEVREVEATTEALTPLMVAGWHQVPAPAFPAYETPGGPARRSFATVGIPVEKGMDLNAAARAALLEMIGHRERLYGFSRPAAYALCPSQRLPSDPALRKNGFVK